MRTHESSNGHVGPRIYAFALVSDLGRGALISARRWFGPSPPARRSDRIKAVDEGVTLFRDVKT